MIELFEKYIANLGLDSLIKKKELHQEFLNLFPYEKLKNMPLEEYALGVNPQGSFSWWLEYNTIPLGSIKGGNAGKHIIYYKKKENTWIYPPEFENEQDAWERLRSDILETIDHLNKRDYEPLVSTNLLNRGNMLKGKISYLYSSDKLMPIYQEQHLKKFLSELGTKEDELITRDTIELSILLHEKLYEHSEFKQYDEIVLANFLYTTFMQQDVIYKIAPGKDAENWDSCKENSIITLGWNDVGDLSQYNDFKEFKKAFIQQGFYDNASTNTRKANEVWDFYNLQPGDRVLANKGTTQVLAIGTVNEKGYKYGTDLQRYQHTVGVTWDTIYEGGLTIPAQKKWKTVTVDKVPVKTVDGWIEGETNSIITIQTEKIENNNTLFPIIEKAIARKGQIILYGPPGTGKTYTVLQYLRWKEEQKPIQLEFCTFHPSYQYEDFIEGFKPVEQNGTVSFKMQDGVFKQFIQRAQQSPSESFYFIIDELNRGNVPKIFGELITLLEKDKRGMALTLPQSKDPFSVPKNVYLIATMNTADRSIKMMDAAIKRRFAFVECMPEYDLLDAPIDMLNITPAQILKELNKKIVEVQGRDLQIGHAYFMDGGTVVSTVDQLKDIFQYDIVPLVQEYCFDNYSMLAEIFGESFVDVHNQEINGEIFSDHDAAFIEALESHFQVNDDER
ncbi:AAA family ATPase [Paenisporosarcina quisquiliarum]|uniref:AAA family ATPase n=1 Tax=Paenisporosarcina quisquiliarum TaxID=365346 RepID=UPI003736389D